MNYLSKSIVCLFLVLLCLSCRPLNLSDVYLKDCRVSASYEIWVDTNMSVLIKRRWNLNKVAKFYLNNDTIVIRRLRGQFHIDINKDNINILDGNDLRQGWWVRHNDSELLVSQYKNDTINGYLLKFNNSGCLVGLNVYKNGRREGPCYINNAGIKAIRLFKNGEQIKVLKYYVKPPVL